MDIWHITAFVLGFGAGYLNRFSIETIRGILFGAPAVKPARLVPNEKRVTWSTTAPVAIESVDHVAEWKVSTHRFITLAEMVGREYGKPAGKLPSYDEFNAALGGVQRYDRYIQPYVNLLAKGGVLRVVSRGGTWWLVGKGGRRAALPALPYPYDSSPPDLPFHA